MRLNACSPVIGTPLLGRELSNWPWYCNFRSLHMRSSCDCYQVAQGVGNQGHNTCSRCLPRVTG